MRAQGSAGPGEASQGVYAEISRSICLVDAYQIVDVMASLDSRSGCPSLAQGDAEAVVLVGASGVYGERELRPVDSPSRFG